MEDAGQRDAAHEVRQHQLTTWRPEIVNGTPELEKAVCLLTARVLP